MGDDQIWAALGVVQLKDVIEGLDGQLGKNDLNQIKQHTFLFVVVTPSSSSDWLTLGVVQLKDVIEGLDGQLGKNDLN